MDRAINRLGEVRSPFKILADKHTDLDRPRFRLEGNIIKLLYLKEMQDGPYVSHSQLLKITPFN